MSQRINNMFGRIADRYDAANTALSFGIHRRWRAAAVEAATPEPGQRLLDGATGTGDLAFRLADEVAPDGSVVALDFNDRMLDEAREKQTDRNPPVDIEWRCADLLDLPFNSNTFDRATVGFGIRNVDDPTRAIAELHRVLKPSGRLVILEFGQPDGLFGHLYDFYSEAILPRLGGIITGDPDAYRYLHESAADFPCGDAFVQIMKDAAPLDAVCCKPLTGGISWLYIADATNT